MRLGFPATIALLTGSIAAVATAGAAMITSRPAPPSSGVRATPPGPALTSAAVAMTPPATGPMATAPKAPTPPAVRCPLAPSSAMPTGDAWAFTDTQPLRHSVAYIHGRGHWTDGRGSGTICAQETGTTVHLVVLKVLGKALLATRITRGGHVGVGLTLSDRVSAGDDPSCPVGNRGSVKLFASYYAGHHDILSIGFSGTCSDFTLSHGTRSLKALIAANGRQVG